MTEGKTTEEKLKGFEKRGLCGKTPFIKRLSPHYMEKARHNLLFSEATYRLCGNEEAKKALSLAQDFSAFDWVTIVAYYSMYHSALATLAAIGYKSDNHAATLLALEVHFVKKELLEPIFLCKLENAKELEAEYVRKLRIARKQRETAQYTIGEETGKDASEKLLKDARDFVDRMERLLNDLQPAGAEEG